MVCYEIGMDVYVCVYNLGSCFSHLCQQASTAENKMGNLS